MSKQDSERPAAVTRVSIWSVSESDLRFYSVAFPLLWVMGVAYHLWAGVEWAHGWQAGIDQALLDVGSIGISAAVTGMILLVIRRIIMVLFDWPSKRERLARKAREEGREEGIEEAREKFVEALQELFRANPDADPNEILEKVLGVKLDES